MEDIFGYLAGVLTTVSFVPQAYKVIISKNVEGLSLLMYLIFTIGVICWFTYGLFIASSPMIIFNGITLFLSLIILFSIFRHREIS